MIGLLAEEKFSKGLNLPLLAFLFRQSFRTAAVRIFEIITKALILLVKNNIGGRGGIRTGSVDFFKIHYSAITTPPPEANSLITNERQ
jgi:hypothetical protein